MTLEWVGEHTDDKSEFKAEEDVEDNDILNCQADHRPLVCEESEDLSWPTPLAPQEHSELHGNFRKLRAM